MNARRLIRGHLKLILLALKIVFRTILSRQACACVVVPMIAFLYGGVSARAGEGLGISGIYYVGLIGYNKNHTTLTQCPAGTFVTGVRHVDRANLNPTTAYGMTAKLDIYCSRVLTDGTAINLGPPFTVNGAAYDQQGTMRTAVCPAGMIARAFYGRDRYTSGRWASQVGIQCTRLALKAGQWIHFNTASNTSRLDAGVVEGNASHTSRGAFCGGNDDRLFTAYARQRGGEGYDGIRVHCGYFAQARLSAAIGFSDFAWDQTVGGAGWNTALAQGGDSAAQWSRCRCLCTAG